MKNCRFCELVSSGNYTASNEHAVAFPDSFPLSNGHTLVIPRLHEADIFDLKAEVRIAVWKLVDVVNDHLSRDLSPDGFNIGVNVLGAAGQTVPHAHVHVIPRTTGDIADPRGGVRWALPDKAPYWDSK